MGEKRIIIVPKLIHDIIGTDNNKVFRITIEEEIVSKPDFKIDENIEAGMGVNGGH